MTTKNRNKSKLCKAILKASYKPVILYQHLHKNPTSNFYFNPKMFQVILGGVSPH